MPQASDGAEAQGALHPQRVAAEVLRDAEGERMKSDVMPTPPAPRGRRRLTKTQKAWRELTKAAKVAKRSKFNARKTERDGILFDSKREADTWPLIRAMRDREQIFNLERQKTYTLVVNGVHICNYRSDFEWDEFATPDPTNMAERHVVADVKGFRTREYLIKRALMKAIHGIEIREL
jgi:hypothetical protein